MPALPTPEEKQLIAREFIAQEEMRKRRRVCFARVFWIGLPALMGSAFLRAFALAGGWSALLALLGIVCVLLYTGFIPVPRTLAQDLSLDWHLNPWRDTLRRLSAENRHVSGLILLICYPVSLMIFEFVSFALW